MGGAARNAKRIEVGIPDPAPSPQLPFYMEPREAITNHVGQLLGARKGGDEQGAAAEGADGTADAKGGSMVVAIGIGGSGKTVFGASIARDVGVRQAYNHILWATLGQTPNVTQIIQQLFRQVKARMRFHKILTFYSVQTMVRTPVRS